ncbi:hypothetical protein LCGC14_1052900 [marine sediment metagenome]|uniref:Uncharacterized protein n=1 Tax=marine sediment metagenome TaxID=412755 RepID=A0A0F9Q6I1_9ZZZZ
MNIDTIKSVAKAIAGGFVGVAAYVVGAGVRFDDPLWFAGLVLFLGAGYGIVWVVPNKAT